MRVLGLVTGMLMLVAAVSAMTAHRSPLQHRLVPRKGSGYSRRRGAQPATDQWRRAAPFRRHCSSIAPTR